MKYILFSILTISASVYAGQYTESEKMAVMILTSGQCKDKPDGKQQDACLLKVRESLNIRGKEVFDHLFDYPEKW